MNRSTSVGARFLNGSPVTSATETVAEEASWRTSLSQTYHDSDSARKPLASEMSNLWAHRGLIRLIVTRDPAVRCKRSTLGVWRTLFNPLLAIGAMNSEPGDLIGAYKKSVDGGVA